MFHHMVMFRFPDPATSQQVIDKLHELEGQIDEVVSLVAGLDRVGSDRSYDVGMLMTFADTAAFERYNTHPLHVPAAQWIDGLATDAVAVDWEI